MSGEEGSNPMGASASSRRSRRLAARQQQQDEQEAAARAAQRAGEDAEDESSEDADFEMGSDDSDSAAGDGLILEGDSQEEGSGDDDDGGVYGVERFLVSLSGWGRRARLTQLGRQAAAVGPLDPNPPPLQSELSQEVLRATCADLGAHPPGPAAERALAKGPGDLRLRSPAQMLRQREANAAGTARGWGLAQRCHLAGLHFRPNKPLALRARMQSRAYIGQHSHDGSLFVAAFQADKRVRVYDTERGWRLTKDVHARNIRWTVTDTCLSGDQRSLLYATINPTVNLVRLGDEAAGVDSVANVTEIHEGLETDVLVGAPPDSGGREHYGIFSIAWAADGCQFAAGTSDFHVLLFDMHTGKTATKIRAHQDDVNAVVFLDDSSNIIASGADDHLIKVWDRRALGRGMSRPAGVLVGHTQGLTHLDPRGDGRHLLSNCKDQTVKAWDVRRMLSAAEFAALPAPGLPRFQWDYRWTAFPFRGRNLRHPNDVSVQTFHGHHVAQTLIRAYWSPAHTTGQRLVYSASADGAVYIWDTVSSKLVERLSYSRPGQQHAEILRDASWHPFRQSLVTAGFDGALVEWGRSDEPLSQHLAALPDTGYDGLEDAW